MSEENISQEFRLNKIAEGRNYLFKEINQNELMSKKYKKVCRVLNYDDHLLTVLFTITGCVSISPFPCLIGIPIGILISAIVLKICTITTEIKKYKSIINKKKKKHDKIVLLANSNSKLNSIEVLISKALIHSVISHDELVLINNVLKEYNKIKKEIKI